MKDKPLYLEKLLLEALDKSGLNAHELAELSGVSQSILWRFINGERSITLPTASKLIEALELEVTIKPKGKKKRQVKK